MSLLNQIKTEIKESLGRVDAIPILTAILFFCGGDLLLCVLLTQLTYWTDRTKIQGGWIAKSSKEWEQEIGIKESTLKRKIKLLKKLGLLKTKIKKFNGAPTTHYKIEESLFRKTFKRFLDFGYPTIAQLDEQIAQNGPINPVKKAEWIQSILRNDLGQNGLIDQVKMDYSITELTTETTTKLTTEREGTALFEKNEKGENLQDAIKHDAFEKEKSCAKKEKVEIAYPYEDQSFKGIWEAWKTSRWENHQLKYSLSAEQAALFVFSENSYPIAFAKELLRKAIANGWKDFHFNDTPKQFQRNYQNFGTGNQVELDDFIKGVAEKWKNKI